MLYNRKKIALLVSGSIGLDLLKSFKKQKLKSDIIIIDKKCKSSQVSKIKKLKKSKKYFFAGKKFSKNVLRSLIIITIIYIILTIIKLLLVIYIKSHYEI